MEILWIAIVFYSIGLGLVLHFRPSLMFNENGTWKEFGYKRSADARHTMFPFWLFAISWAFVSYALAATLTWVFPAMGLTTAIATATASVGSYSQSEYNDSETDADSDSDDDRIAPVSGIVEPPRRGRGRPRKSDVTETKEAKQPRPGYYMLEPTTREGGLRKYMYYGSKPPPTEEED